MQVSVVIPVYNAAAYVREAVESALGQPEAAEVILVEDGSSDDSLTVCQKLAAEHPKVHLYRHPNSENRGAAATRNLAILKSSGEYVAFLDADDFFLPERFSVPAVLFEGDPSLDGVYEAVGMYVQDEAGAQRWVSAGRRLQRLTTMGEHIAPEHLFAALARRGAGGIHLDGLVVRHTLFEKTGLFDERLRLHQDSAMILKMAALGRLAPGRLDEPVAMRRVHSQNRISAPRPRAAIYADKIRFWRTMLTWSKGQLGEPEQQLMLDALLKTAGNTPRFEASPPAWLRPLQKRFQLTLLALSTPWLCFSSLFWKHFLPRPRFWLGAVWSKSLL